jgi:hypothetical protein
VAHEEGEEEEGLEKAVQLVNKCITYLWNYKELDDDVVNSCLHKG